MKWKKDYDTAVASSDGEETVESDLSDCVEIWVVVICLALPDAIKCTWHFVIIIITATRDKSFSLPPGTLGYPFIGETLEFLRKGSNFYKLRQEKYGNIFKTHIFGCPTIRVIGAENVRKILHGENSIVMQSWPKSTKLLLGSGAMTQTSGEIHRSQRKQVLHAFSMHALAEYVPIIQSDIRKQIETWLEKGTFLGYNECREMTMSISSKVLLGFDFDVEEKQRYNKMFLDFTAALMTIPINVPGFGFHKGMKAREGLLAGIKGQLKKLSSKEGQKSFKTAFEYYLDALDEEEITMDTLDTIAEGALDLIANGFSTTSSALTNLIMILGKHENVLQNVREELYTHGLLDPKNVDLTLNSLKDLPYSSKVLKELLRLYPPAGASFRKCLQTFELEGYTIPAGWTVMYSIRETHRNPNVYDDAEEFRPDRWDDSSFHPGTLTSESPTDKFNFIPFGGGCRSCVGSEFAKLSLRIFLLELARSCDWTLLNKDAEMRFIPVPHAVDSLPVQIRRWDHCSLFSRAPIYGF
ncbi:hypothetical protein ACJMK2_004913 [Sinanodonta woodiana]|uniref:Cytochrome P450 n=1 Tax=Sinanodonta woodiana TaxID=1069815 RepID=A0ABD3VNG6_SINWO